MADTANPFSARSLRPGTISYLFPQGESAAAIVQRWIASGQRGQIIGPHGSGKSTLLATMAPAWREAGFVPCTFSLRDRQRKLPSDWKAQVAGHLANDQPHARGSQDASGDKAVVVVDGYEQLSVCSRVRLRLACRWQGWGLMATAHRDVGLPTVMTTSTSVALATAVVNQLDPVAGSKLGSDVIADCFVRCKGDLRETLFALYDQYERILAKM